MITLEVETNKLFCNLVAINISIFNGGKLNCNAIGCEDDSIKNHLFTNELKKSNKITLNCNINNKSQKCVSLVEKELTSRLNITSHELKDIYHEKSEGDGHDKCLEKHYNSIIIYKDNDQIFHLNEVEQIPYMKFTAVVKKDKNDIGVLLNGLDKNNKQVSWLKKTISENSKIFIEFTR